MFIKTMVQKNVQLILTSLGLLTIMFFFQNCSSYDSAESIPAEIKTDLLNLSHVRESSRQQPRESNFSSQNIAPVIPGFNNIYSPHMEKVNERLKMYYGGWEDAPPSQTLDTLYRADCNDDFRNCQPEGALLFYDGSKGFVEIPSNIAVMNDPTVVNMGQYLILYFTACPAGKKCGGTAANRRNHRIYSAVSWANDGMHWSKPKERVESAWLPSVTKSPRGDILLYYTNVDDIALMQMNLGKSGVDQQGVPQSVNTGGVTYANVEVRYQPALLAFQVVAERITSGRGGIDYLHDFSEDGLNFSFIKTIATPLPGFAQIRTPAMHPDNAALLWYGMTQRNDALENQIFFKKWGF